MNEVNTVAVIGNYLPRKCGIATFTTDICESLAAEFSGKSIFAVPVNDLEEGYDYPPRVRFELAEEEVASYRRAADFLNINDVDIVCVQHEYGIFGGPAGAHVLRLLERLRMPVVTTLHTVLKEPDPQQYKVLKELADLSDRLIVMANRGREYLRDIYKVDPAKVDFVHHGIPDFSFADPNFHKDRFGAEGKKVLLTFGLLSPNKGIEYVIEAMPAILEKHPEVVYFVQGATHPFLLRTEGEAYRLKLQRLARDRGVEASVVFHNRFVEIDELMEFINAADIYICPYLNRAQLVSGTIAYTVGAGKAVVSTPLWYSEELLADGRGLIIPERDSKAIADSIVYLLDNEADRHAMRKKAYNLGREMTWSNVARGYMESFDQAVKERAARPKRTLWRQPVQEQSHDLPPLKLDHLRRMTDKTGMLQHGKFTVPDYNHGYCVDDNARALILAVMLERRTGKLLTSATDLASVYLGFLHYAYDAETKRFRDFLSYAGKWRVTAGSDDAHGRALWALGTVIGRSRNPGFQKLAMHLFEECLPVARNFHYLRSCAFVLLGIQELFRKFYGHSAAQEIRQTLAERLLEAYKTHATPDWPWFDESLTYSNAKIPHALMQCGQWMERGDMVEAALTSLDWLCKIQQRDGGHFVPIGNNGFYRRGGQPARFDQQPVEAQCMVSACIEAYRVTGEARWLKEAHRAFNWFLGANDLGEPVIDALTGACFDGIQPDHINQNQGAESTLAYLLSLMEMTLAESGMEDEEYPPAPPKPLAKAAAK